MTVACVFVGPSCGAGLNQTSITCPQGRTLLDGVCVNEAVADYVACVRAQGAQLGAERGQKISAEAGYLGVKAGGAAEVSESLSKKYSASDAAMLAIIQACNGAAQIANAAAAAKGTARKDLAAHWTFDETSGTGVSDATGHGNTGTFSRWSPQNSDPTWVAGRVGGALKLDGTTEILVADDPSQHSAHALTITGWFLLTKHDHMHPWREIVIKTNPKGENWWGCAAEGVNDPNPCDEREYGVTVHSDELSLTVYAVTEDRYKNGGQQNCTTPRGAVQFGKWHHFAGVISSKSRATRVFLDGALVATCPISEAGLRRTSNKLHIGTNWYGMIDDLRLYSSELTGGDIAALARAN